MKSIHFIAAALICANVVYADANEFAKAKQQGTKALIQYGRKLEKAKKYREKVEKNVYSMVPMYYINFLIHQRPHH